MAWRIIKHTQSTKNTDVVSMAKEIKKKTGFEQKNHFVIFWPKSFAVDEENLLLGSNYVRQNKKV